MAKEAEKTRLWHDLELKLVGFINYCAKFCVAIAFIFLPQEYLVGSGEWGVGSGEWGVGSRGSREQGEQGKKTNDK
ncbi:hypothetical protein COO91_05240 [Nostoc flagelliforme CCNUN1]|uniref:Uncharacterized protein n=1 Tax=Nostoc flagelliforme CCNUN1 TaxID=2038116 RepID=A0A2K8SV11_9NOSO|nr:hypothetical protein [Nostoc flagelliforme]AUB39248.1 hypothetical protein COO91_05240 [Nostoc flagelliforme CCNUN1]